jgi:hypothetical protein
MKSVIILVWLIILSSCATSPRIPKFIEGCLYGTISTYSQLQQQPFPEEYLESLYRHCEKAENE